MKGLDRLDQVAQVGEGVPDGRVGRIGHGGQDEGLLVVLQRLLVLAQLSTRVPEVVEEGLPFAREDRPLHLFDLLQGFVEEGFRLDVT